MQFNFHVLRILEIGLDNENLKKKLQGVNKCFFSTIPVKICGEKKFRF